MQANQLAQYVVRSNTSVLPALAAIDAGCSRLMAMWVASKEPGDSFTAYDLSLQARLKCLASLEAATTAQSRDFSIHAST